MFGDNKYLLIARLLKTAGVTPQPADLITDLLEKYLLAIGGTPRFGDDYMILLTKIVKIKGGIPTYIDREWDLLVKWLRAIGRTHSFADSIVDLWKKIVDGSSSVASPIIPPSPLLNQLKAHWRLDEASGVRVDVHGGNNLTDVNTVGQAAGKIGNAANFIAANTEVLSIVDNANLSMGDIEMSIAGWVFFNTLDHAGLVSKWASGDLEYIVLTDGVNLNFAVFGTALSLVSNPLVLSTATWYFFVAWHDPVANTINISVNDGAAASGAHTTGVRDGTATFHLGHNEEGISYLDGRLDSVSVWKRLLTAPERTQLYNGGAGLDYPF